MRLIAFFFFYFCLTSLIAKTYEVNTQHSFVNFEVDYMQVSKAKGTFDKFAGTFDLDEKTNEIKDLQFRIKADSINTRDKKRDSHLLRKDFFHVSKYPFLDFEGNSVVYKDGVPVKIKGQLTLRGKTQPVTFDVNWKGILADPVSEGKESLYLNAEATINRKEWGMVWNRSLDQGGFLVGDDVKIEIIVEANPIDARPAFSRFMISKKKILPGKLEMPEEEEDSKKKALESEPTQNAAKNRKLTSFLHLLLGFFLFIALLLLGFYSKKFMLEFFEKIMSEKKAELLSDFLLYGLLMALAVVLAPFMGLQTY